MLIFHGDNQGASRLASTSQKSLSSGINLSGENLTLNLLTSHLHSPSLFGGYPNIYIENFFSRRPSNDKKILIEFFLTLPKNVFIWEAKDVGAQLKLFPPDTVKLFALPSVTFKFLDSFSLPLFHQSLVTSEPEQILGLIAKRLSELLLAKDQKLNLPGWQLAKISAQAQKYSSTQLAEMNTDLLNLDYQIKTSTLPYDLTMALELWLLKLNN